MLSCLFSRSFASHDSEQILIWSAGSFRIRYYSDKRHLRVVFRIVKFLIEEAAFASGDSVSIGLFQRRAARGLIEISGPVFCILKLVCVC